MAEDVDAVLARGHAAQVLLGNETFNVVCDDLVKIAAFKWLATNEREIREREELHSQVRAIEALRGELKSRADAAVKVQSDLTRAEKRKREI